MSSYKNALSTLSLALVLNGAILGSSAMAGPAAAPGRWVTSWYAAPQAGWDGSFALPMNVPASLDNQTVRETLRLSAGGQRLRLVLSNRYGHQPLQVGGVRIGPANGKGPALPLRFSGEAAVTIAPGADAISDPLDLAVAPLARMLVSTYLPAHTPVTSFHWGAQQTIAIEAGNTLAALPTASAGRAGGRLFTSAVMVEAAVTGRTVVTLGDSITDGNGSTPDADRRWPDALAERLAPHDIGVANAGISGARLLRDGMGRSALARFEQDVLSQPGISDLIVLLGINDIGWPGSPFAPADKPVTLEQLRAGWRQLAAAAHTRGVRVTAATLPPFEGALEGTPYAGHYNPDKEQLRVRLNAWIRSAGIFDAVVDFDAVLRDPAHPRRLRADYDSGDHLHPGDAGYRAMAAAIDIAPMLNRTCHGGSGSKPVAYPERDAVAACPAIDVVVQVDQVDIGAARQGMVIAQGCGVVDAGAGHGVIDARPGPRGQHAAARAG
jgi:lysophospholipase L1-like esterase